MFKFFLKPATTNRPGKKFPSKNSRQKTSSTIFLGGRQIPYTIITGGIARYVHIKVSPSEGLQLVVPRFYNLADAQLFMIKKQDWIIKNLKKFENKNYQKPPEFTSGMVINIFGISTQIILIQSLKNSIRKTTAQFTANSQPNNQPSPQLHIFAPTPRKAKLLFQNYLKKEFKKFIMTRTHLLSNQTNLSFNKITVRAQKTRWGSCSSKNNLNFNWLLSLTSPAHIDYVILHELCHTVHHNHSKKFYALLQSFSPNYKILRKELHSHQTLIEHFAR